MSGRIQQARFSSGCFWSTQHSFDQLPGVIDSRIGYSGGNVVNPNVIQIQSGTTGHRETVEVDFDPEKIPFRRLVQHFLNAHDPFRELNRKGGLYRSTIFYFDQEQRQIAANVLNIWRRAGNKDLVTELRPLAPMYPAQKVFDKYYVRKAGGT